jgi:hypothetical protein
MGILRLILILWTIFTSASHALAQLERMTIPSDQTPEEREFFLKVLLAIGTTNISALTALDHVVVGDKPAERTAFYKTVIERGVNEIGLSRVDPAVETDHKGASGTMIHESLPVRWIVSIGHSRAIAGLPGDRTELRAGLLDGKIRFTSPQEKATAAKEKPIAGIQLDSKPRNWPAAIPHQRLESW